MKKTLSLILASIFTFTSVSFSQPAITKTVDNLGPFLVSQLFEQSKDELSELTEGRAENVENLVFRKAAEQYASKILGHIQEHDLRIALADSRDELIDQINEYCLAQNVSHEKRAKIIEAVYVVFNMNDTAESIAGREVSKKLHTPLKAKDAAMAKRFTKGGAADDGYGISEGASIDGSFAVDDEGNQGYYVTGGKKVYTNIVDSMKTFFKNRERILNKPICYVIKPGIGGQHTPNEGIKACFEMLDITTGKIVGEYELGKDYEKDIETALASLGDNVGWDQIAIVPSSKSGTTDETMVIFVELTYLMLKHTSFPGDIARGKIVADAFLKTLHDLNFLDGKEKPNKDLFVTGEKSIIERITEEANNHKAQVTKSDIKNMLGVVIGNMFFETTDNPDQSRLSAFIRHSGLGDDLGENAPGFGAMFEDVGGRWTGDLHMMLYLAYHDLDAGKYWESRYAAIKEVRAGKHIANALGNKILDEGIKRIALVVPDHLFWFGKAMEQNFNESIWQEGFATLITIKESHWNVQSDHYSDKTGTMVINLSGISIPRSHFNSVDVFVNDMRNMRSDDLAIEIGRLFTTFYGMTHTVGTRLIARALGKEGKAVNDVDLNDLDNAATKIVQKNLFVLQPYVELGKGLLKDRLDKLQAAEKQNPGAIAVAMDEMKKQAQDKYFETNVPGFAGHNAKDMKALAALIKQAIDDAKESNRIFLPFIYLEGERFHQLRNYLAELGIEWILQGTGDQHINYQQVLSQPQAYLPFIVSVVPLVESEGRPAIGFAKGYLDNISPNMIRDYFAEASYRALTEEVPKKLGHPEWCKGIFLRLADTEEDLNMLKGAFKMAVENGVKNVGQNDNDTLIADVSAKTGDITVHRNVPNLINAVHVDNKEIAIVVNKNLITKTLAEVSPELRVVFEKEYQVMRQSLSKMFPNENKGVIETNENDIEAITNELIKQGKKVVILDNGFMLGNWDNNTQHIAGVSGVNYCVISAASHPEKELKDAVEFLNLTAMALMGVGVLTDGRDILLFEKAYRLFTGEDPSPEMMEPIRRDPLATVFAIKVLPRMLMLSGSIVERETIRRLFAAAA